MTINDVIKKVNEVEGIKLAIYVGTFVTPPDIGAIEVVDYPFTDRARNLVELEERLDILFRKMCFDSRMLVGAMVTTEKGTYGLS